TELGDHRLLPRDLNARVEVRRLMSWFCDKLFTEVSGPLTIERVLKRQMRREQGGGAPDTEAIRAASAHIRYHLAYIGWLVQTRDGRAGGRPPCGDPGAAATVWSVDYRGEVR